jgi:hypothetical protein
MDGRSRSSHDKKKFRTRSMEKQSSHDNNKFRTRSVEKQRGMAFGFWKMATAVIKLDRQIDSSCESSERKYFSKMFYH